MAAETFAVRPRQLVAGGAAIATGPDGRVVLVEGALPDELVSVSSTRSTARLITASVVEVIEPSPHRAEPPCPAVAQGCGGCDLQFVRPTGLPDMKVEIVRDALRHLGGRRSDAVFPGVPLSPWGFRTTVRAIIDADGRAGFRKVRSHSPVVAGHCEVAHPAIDEILAGGRFPGASQITARVGLSGGERLVVVEPDEVGDGRSLAHDLVVPQGVVIVGPDGAAVGTDGERPAIVERVAGRDWRVSALSFFQTRPDGAEVLVATVNAAVQRLWSEGLDRAGRLVDAYSGVGLLAGSLRSAGWTGPMAAIEMHPDAVEDARWNLDGDDIEIIAGDVNAIDPRPASLVVADPSRSGLGAPAVDRLAATGAEALILVSCDAGSLGRDTALLIAAGFDHRESTLVDMFPHTHHVEVVSTFTR